MPNAPPLIVQGLYSFQIGGSERMAASLALEMRRRGFSVIAFAFYGDALGPIRSQLEAGDVECTGFSFEARSRVRRLTLGWEIESLLRRRGAAAIHLHHGVSAVRAARAARRAGVKQIVLTEHSHAAMDEMPRYRRRVMASLRFVDYATGVNPEVCQYLNDHMAGALKVPAQVVPNAIDDSLFSVGRSEQIRAEHGLQQSFVFVSVGRLHGDKDLPTLFAAFAIVCEKAPDLRPILVVAGDGAEEGPLRALARKLQIEDRIQMWGMQSDVTRVFSVADAFVMSSVREGLPMALIEAMAVGLPCVATSVGSITSTLADGRGRVVPPGDFGALALAMCDTMRGRERSQVTGRAAQSYARKEFALGPVVSKYLTLLGQSPQWGGPC